MVKEIIFHKRPVEFIEHDTFKVREFEIPDEASLGADQVLIKLEYLSMDPAMRGWLNEVCNYIEPVHFNDRMRGAGVGRVVASKSSAFKPGDYVTGFTGWSEYAVLSANEVEKAIIPKGLSPPDALAITGMNGLTAYFGLLDVGQPKAGETVVVSGAAGATGTLVGQIAKIKGARVIGIVGSDDKCQFIKQLGFDHAINYKSPNWKNQLAELTPDLIDVFFDNVGGDVLNECLGRAATHARFPICGAISEYNSTTPNPPVNYTNINPRRIKVQGFLVFDYAARNEEAIKDLTKWAIEGKLKSLIDVRKGKLEDAPIVLNELFHGNNKGKLILELIH